MDYPHTTISADTSALIASLEDSDSDKREERLELANRVREHYFQKKEFYVTRINELENEVEDLQAQVDDTPEVPVLPEYPHTDIQANMRRLRDSLENSTSGRRDERLDLLAEIEREYLVKRDWFTAVRDAVEA